MTFEYFVHTKYCYIYSSSFNGTPHMSLERKPAEAPYGISRHRYAINLMQSNLTLQQSLSSASSSSTIIIRDCILNY